MNTHTTHNNIVACCGLGDCNTGRHVPQLHIAGTLSVSELCLMEHTAVQ